MADTVPDYRTQCTVFLNKYWNDGIEEEAEMIHSMYTKFVELDSGMGHGLPKDAAVRFLEQFERNPKNKKKLKESQLAKIFKEIVSEPEGKLTATAYLMYRYKKTEPAAAASGETAEVTRCMDAVRDAVLEIKETKTCISTLVSKQGVEEEYALKPMNCPGHCLMFRQRVRSYRDLPIRYADFGVLHRNELSGALSGLTRVRRFQQDDGHIFCMTSQIKSEMKNCLKFLKDIYAIFGFDFKLKLSTRPEKYMGEIAQWDFAEAQLTECLDEFAAESGRDWVVDPGDGAFYGPKIDITVFDALQRAHQCATIQLDFQLPIRFDLEYTSADQNERFQRPVMIHRAILGSVERMMAILTEHYAGKWPFWLSPRQIMIVPIAPTYYDYAHEVCQIFKDDGYQIEVDASKETVNKKIRNAQTSYWNYIFVVGEAEANEKSVNVRTRDNKIHGMKTITDVCAHMKNLTVHRLRQDPWDADQAKKVVGDDPEDVGVDTLSLS